MDDRHAIIRHSDQLRRTSSHRLVPMPTPSTSGRKLTVMTANGDPPTVLSSSGHARGGSLLRRLATIAVAGGFALASCFPFPEASTAPPPLAQSASSSAVQVTDVRDSAFFVTWTTDVADTGAVRWGPAGSAPTTRVPDIRGDGVSSTVHFVRVTGLNASTSYVFDVVTGNSTDDRGGSHYQVTTGPSLNLTASDSIYGRITDSGGAPAKNVAVVLTVRSPDGSASAPMGAFIGQTDDGYWTANLGNTRVPGNQASFVAVPGSKIEINANAGAGGTVSITVDASVARTGVPALKLSGTPGGQSSTVPATPTAMQVATSTPIPTATAPSSGGNPVGGAGGVPPVVPAPIVPAGPGAPLVLPPVTAPNPNASTGNVAGSSNPGISPPSAVRLVLDIPASGALYVPVTGTGRAAVTLDEDTRASLANIGVAKTSVVFDPSPVLENQVQAGSVGGGVVQPISLPIDLRIDLRDAEGQKIVPPDSVTAPILVSMPVPSVSVPPEGVIAWLVATYDRDGFAGYVRPPAIFDPNTGRTTLSIPVQDLQGTLFLPAIIVPATVVTLDPDAHLWSGVQPDAADFGPVGPQFSSLVVVAPQVRSRLYVFNPATENYGWIDVSAVGPG